jgi:signal transduction histidine kinase
VESGLPAVRGNPPLLQQVLVDLTLNACNAMPSGGTLTVSAARPEPGWVAIRLRDTGRGIPVESLPRVFEPFFTTSEHGVGLGLAVSYSIIRQHGGTIQVESEVGKGTTFTIRLPAAAGA